MNLIVPSSNVVPKIVQIVEKPLNNIKFNWWNTPEDINSQRAHVNE